MSLATSTILDRAPEGGDRCERALAELQETIRLQRQAFRRHPYPSAGERIAHLQAVIGMLMGNRDRIRAAVSEDFGSHPAGFTDLIEILGPVGRATIALEQLGSWMADEERPVDPALFGTARATMRHEPKGVIGNMVPWNFPFEIGCGALVEMLAAGNRVVIKPSDLTPACGALLAELVGETFDRDHVAVSVGGLELAREFSRQRWDHLMYTGSPGVGRQVMAAAAENLVPVTLELGGKCPAVLTPSGVTREAVEAVLGTKMIKNGQMCVTADHVLVPRDRVTDFIEMATAHVRSTTPNYSRSEDCVGIITERHLDRLVALLDEAREAGAEIIELEEGGGVDRTTRRMPLSLVIDPAPELRVSTEEIFGPILPVIPYDDLDEAVDAIDAHDRPLGVYVFGADVAECEGVVRATRSGGACINACAIQGAIPTLGFGGSGTSGMGRHHGIEGFREFSNARGVAVRGEGDNLDVLYPPYSGKLEQVVAAAFSPPAE